MRAVGCELWQMLGGLRPRQQHGVAQMMPGGLAARTCGKEDALVDLEAVLVALQECRLGGDCAARRRQAGHRGGGREHQIFQTRMKLRAVVGQFVDRAPRHESEKLLALRARAC